MAGRASPTIAASVALVASSLVMPTALFAQAAPELSKGQRTLLQAIVHAVDGAAASPETPDATLRTHVMRASDGSQYVAFSLKPSAVAQLPPGPIVLYVRLATATPSNGVAQRSAIREWLASNATTLPAAMRPVVTVGEMPVFGSTGTLEKRAPTIDGSTTMQLMALDRQRERERQQARDAQRRVERDGSAPGASEMMPFEDFDLAAQATIRGDRVIERALTVGPGDYELYVAWADTTAPSPAATIQVIKAGLRLPPFSDTLALTSIIVADGVRTRGAPYAPSEQAAHPYSIGLTEITPAPDTVFKSDEQLAVAFQIINARPADTGKPNLEVNLDVVRIQAGQEQPVASLKPQFYSAATLPADFDLRAGHPLLAAISAPLETLKPGAYQLKIAVNDRLANRTATATAAFTIAATAMSILSEAPALAPPFRADPFVGPEVLGYVIKILRPASPSASLRRALDVAAAGRFTELLEEPVAESEEGVRAALRGLSLLAFGDGSSAVHFQRATLLGAPVSATRLLSGAARALQDRDADAITAWQEALSARAPWALVAPFLLDAHLRRADYQRAAALIADTKDPPATAAWIRSVAATQIGMRREGEAITVLDRHLAKQPDDAEAQWLLLHALYSQFAHGDTANRGRLSTQLRAYANRNGAHADVARAWLAFVDQGASPK